MCKRLGLAFAVWLGLFGTAIAAEGNLDQLLVDAVVNNRSKQVKALLDKGASTEAKGYLGNTPLIIAAGNGDLDTIDLLLASGASTEAENDSGQTALTRGIENATVVRRLLAAGTRVNRPNKAGVTPLMAAAEMGNTSVVSLLLAHGADPKARTTADEGVLGKALSHLKTAEGKAIFRQLLDAGAPIDTHDYFGFTPFHSTIAMGWDEAARELIARGAKPWEKTSDGSNALDIAVRGPTLNEPILQLLLSLHPPQEVLDQSLHVAARADNFRALVLLHQAGADLHSQYRSDTLLGTAIIAGAWEVTRGLLRRGFSPNEPASEGKVPLELAMEKGHTDLMRLLLRSGANPNWTNAEGQPLLVSALNNGDAASTELLAAAGADKTIKVSDVPLKTLVQRSGEKKLIAAFNKKSDRRTKGELGLVAQDDKTLFKNLVGQWNESEGYIKMTLRPDGTYTRTAMFLGMEKSDRGFWSISDGDLVIDERESPTAAPSVTACPIIWYKPKTLVMKFLERSVWNRGN